MSKDTTITRVIQIDDKTIHITIRLTEDEVRRLLLPHVVQAVNNDLLRLYRSHVGTTLSAGTIEVK